MTNQPWTPWTPRETEIVRLTAEGLTAQQIARRLVLAPKTVENHIWRAKQKVDCPNRAALVAYAVTHGLTDPPTEPIRVFRDPEGDWADAELERLICDVERVVTNKLDADDVVDIALEPPEPEVDEVDESPRRRPRSGIVAVVLVLLALAGVGAYAFVHTPDVPAAVPAAPVLETTTSPASSAGTTSPAPPSGKRKSRAATVDATFDELRTAAKRAHDGANAG